MSLSIRFRELSSTAVLIELLLRASGPHAGRRAGRFVKTWNFNWDLLGNAGARPADLARSWFIWALSFVQSNIKLLLQLLVKNALLFDLYKLSECPAYSRNVCWSRVAGQPKDTYHKNILLFPFARLFSGQPETGVVIYCFLITSGRTDGRTDR